VLDTDLAEFDRLEGPIQAALAYTGDPPTHTPEHLKDAIMRERMQFWPAGESFAITELLTTPSGVKMVNFFLAGGNLRELHVLLPVIEGWARSQGCHRAMCIGRPGWSRTFLTRDEGWQSSMWVFEKELGYG
jgi:hypothetical protein